MKGLKFALFGFLVLSIFAAGALAQEVPADADVRGDHPKGPADTIVQADISSTAAGDSGAPPRRGLAALFPGGR